MGNKEVLTIRFNPNTSSYFTFGEEIVILVEFTDDELLKILTNIRNNIASYNFTLKGKLIDKMENVEINLKEVIEITQHK